MNVILIMGNSTPRVVSYIKNENGVSINIQRSANTVDEIENFLIKTLTKTDLLLFTDDALGYDYMKSIVKLKTALERGYLTASQIIHFTTTRSNISDSTVHVLGDFNLKIVKRDDFTFKTVLNAITGELNELKEVDSTKSLANVVRVKKHSRDVEVFEESKTNDSVIITTKKKIGLSDKTEALESIKEVKGSKQLSKFSQKISTNKLQQVDPSLPMPNPSELPLPDLHHAIIDSGTTVIVTGERKSGKTVFAQALAYGYSKDYKVMLITDSNSISDDLQTEAVKLSILDFKSNISDSILKTTAYGNKLVLLNDFSGVSSDIQYLLLDIIYFNIRDNFDLIIIDLQLTKYIETPGIAANSNLICITSPLYISSINSLTSFLQSINMYLHKTQYLYVPTSIFHSVGGLKKYTPSAAKTAIINAIKYDKVQTLPELQFKSINAGPQLLDLVTPYVKKGSV